MMNSKEEFNEVEEVQNQINSMYCSVSTINQLISDGNHTFQVHDTIERNYRHLEIMLDKEHIQNSGEDFTTFIDTIDSAKVYIQSPLT